MEDSIRYITGRSQGTRLNISNSASQTTVSEAGVYELYATCNCRVKIDHLDASNVTAATGALLLGGNSAYFHIPAGYKLGVIAESASLTGVLEHHFVRP